MSHRHHFEFQSYGPRHGRLFEKGDLKYVILDQLKEKPSHGYEIIRTLEERFQGFYSPSAGSIYPTLQLLEDMGCVKSTEQDGKRVYTITDEGNKFLADREEIIDKIKEHVRDWRGMGKRENFRETMHEFRDLVQMLGQQAQRLDDDKMARIKDIIAKSNKDIEAILKQ
jgi:DNA-binding PadR family transcriptional regulator